MRTDRVKIHGDRSYSFSSRCSCALVSASAGLPRPRCQVEIETPWGVSYWLDIGHPELRLAAEYDGEQFHGEERMDHDEARREWIRAERDWTIVVARRDNVHGPAQDIHAKLWKAWKAAEVKVSAPTRP